jgi:hypothetical protein
VTATVDTTYTNSKITLATTLAVTTGAVATGKKIIVACVRDDSAGATGGVSVSDTRGNTYTLDAISLNSASAEVALFSAQVTTALQSGDSITATWNTSRSRNLIAAHVCSGLKTTGRDATTGTTVVSNPTSSGANGTSLTATGTTGTTTDAQGLTFAAVTSTNNASSLSAGSGYTATGVNMVTAAGSTDRRLFTEYKTTVTTGTQTATATLGVSADWAVAVAHYPSVVAANVAPTANAGADQSNVKPYSTVTLDGSGSSDSDGTITTYSWSQTGGSPTVSLSGSGATRTFTAPGTLSGTVLTFSLTVTDNDGANSTANTMTVTVALVPERLMVGGVWIPAKILIF